MNIILIGFRGTGKSAIGRGLAKLAGMGFADADDEIEKRAGKTIKEIFRERGEPAFREMEKGVIAALCRRRNTVIAAGGGAVLDSENVRNMRSAGVIVLLESSASTIHERLQRNARRTERQRPALTALQPESEIRHLLEVRKPCYEKAADFRISTEHTRDRQAALKIMEVLGIKAKTSGNSG